jgi:hypothetical protein
MRAEFLQLITELHGYGSSKNRNYTAPNINILPNLT